MSWSTRDARPPEEAAPQDAASPAPVGDRWAVVVGVNRYRHKGLNLRFARDDAAALFDLLRTKEGGDFPEANIRFLVDEEATTSALTKAVRGFLLAARPDDLVLMFFACHGGPDPRRPGGPLYLYTHDTDPDDVAGTAFAMDEINTSLQRLVQARRVVILADTCHSGGLGQGQRAGAVAAATNVYLDALAKSKGGVALLTSAEAAEASEEDERWGGGHGAFTHYLLEGMRGAADGYKSGARNGVVTVGELFEYVRDRVQEDTEGRQHPMPGPAVYDRSLPVAVTGDLDVTQHLAQGRRLAAVGWALDDPAPFLLAARQFAQAADLKRVLAEADAERGTALLAAGRPAEAVKALRGAVESGEDLPAEARLFLGVAAAETDDAERAVAALREFARRAPAAPEAGWAAAYADWLERASPAEVHGLLVGVGTFRSQAMNLRGPANDVALLREVLTGPLGAAPEHVVALVDEAGTRPAVLAALADLRDRVGPNDIVVVSFSGHSEVRAGTDGPFLITTETGSGEQLVGVSARELVDALTMPARAVVLVLDTHVSAEFVDLAVAAASASNLTVLLASGVGEMAYELARGERTYGAFTAAVADGLRAGTPTSGALVDAAATRLATEFGLEHQRPRLIGDRDRALLAGSWPAATLWRAWRSRSPRGAGVGRLAATEAPWPVADAALGRAAAAAGRHAEARRRLERAHAALLGEPVVALDLAAACLGGADVVAARAALEAARAAADGRRREHVEAAVAALAERAPARPALVLVWTGPRYAADALAQSAMATATRLAEAAGIAPADVVVASGPDATGERLLGEVAALGRRSGERLGLLVVIGEATAAPNGEAQLAMADGRLAARELAAAAGGARNLVCVLEAVPGTNLVPRDVTGAQPRPDPWPEASPDPLPLGGVSLVFAHAEGVADRAVNELAEALPRALREGWTYEQWTAAVSVPGRLAGHGGGRVLEDRVAVLAALDRVQCALLVDAEEAATAARNAIEGRRLQGQDHPEGYLQLGLALAAQRRWREAIDVLRTARNLYEDVAVFEAERAHDPLAPEWRRQARYHYGRLQYAHGDNLDDAVGAMNAALRDDPDDPRVLLHLARAIREQVERETLVVARTHYLRYLELGAPLGREPRDAELAGP